MQKCQAGCGYQYGEEPGPGEQVEQLPGPEPQQAGQQEQLEKQ